MDVLHIGTILWKHFSSLKKKKSIFAVLRYRKKAKEKNGYTQGLLTSEVLAMLNTCIMMWTHKYGECVFQLHLQHTIELLENCKIIAWRKIAVELVVELCGSYMCMPYFCGVLFCIYTIFFSHCSILLYSFDFTIVYWLLCVTAKLFVRKYLWRMKVVIFSLILPFFKDIFTKYRLWIKYAI